MKRACGALLSGILLSACSAAPQGTPTVAPTVALPTPRPTTTPRPTPTLAAATPPPQRESVITPTPIVYVVQSGDTLIPIANKFGVSVSDIVAANNGLDAASLQIGQRLIIPTNAGNPAASNAAQLLLPTPTPIPFEIRGTNIIRTAAGSLECLGEIFNGGPAPLTNVQVQLTLQDDAGNPLQAQTVFVARDVIGPGETSPFRVLFTAPPSAFSKFAVIPLRAEAGNASALATIKVDKLTGTPNGAQFKVTGELTNGDQVDTTSLRMIVTAYDGDKRVIGYRYVDAPQQALAVGATTPFEVSIVTASQSIATFSLIAEGGK